MRLNTKALIGAVIGFFALLVVLPSLAFSQDGALNTELLGGTKSGFENMGEGAPHD